MKPIRFVPLLAVLLVVVGATAGHLIGRARQRAAAGAGTVVTGVIGSEKERFFADPDVVRAFARHGLRLRVDPRGSRQMSTIDLGGYDFAFPGSEPAASDVARHRQPVSALLTPFRSPMAVATFRPIVELLQSAHLAARSTTGQWVLDLRALVQANRTNLRWDQVPGNLTYPVRRNVLIATTRPADSNSAAMYAALLDDVTGHDLAAVVKLFADQGALDRTSEEPFDSYLRRGSDFAPLVLVYEAQFVDLAAAGDRSVGGDRMLVYPSPTVLSDHTVVPFTAHGTEVAQLLLNDPTLQDLAARHGFRTADPARSAPVLAKVTSGGAPLPTSFDDVIAPPGAEALDALLIAVEAKLT